MSRCSGGAEADQAHSYALAALMPSAPSRKPHQDRVAAAKLLTRDETRRRRSTIIVVYGAETPPRSRAEIEALAGLPTIWSYF